MIGEPSLLRGPSTGPVAGLGELFVRHARRDGRSVAILRAVDHGDAVTVECEVFGRGGEPIQAPPPFRFADARQATAFAIEAVEALTYLGCEIASA